MKYSFLKNLVTTQILWDCTAFLRRRTERIFILCLNIWVSYWFCRLHAAEETDLHKVIKRGNILHPIHKQFIMYQLLTAVNYLHSAEVIHRDLKVSYLDFPFVAVAKVPICYATPVMVLTMPFIFRIQQNHCYELGMLSYSNKLTNCGRILAISNCVLSLSLTDLVVLVSFDATIKCECAYWYWWQLSA